jgi:16S rRNA (cytosine967-C5)-methyltransferase
VLRRLSVEGAGRVERQDAARLNTPEWLWHSWSRAYGDDLARAIATAHLKEAPLDLTVRTGEEGWQEKLQATKLPTGSLRRPAGGSVMSLPGYAEGAWWIQDAAASLPVRLFNGIAGREVVDLCAAPGGKTAQLANAGAQVTAVDRSTRRLDRLVTNLNRLQRVKAVAADALDLAAGPSGGRRAARCALHRDRRDPAPPRRPASGGTRRSRGSRWYKPLHAVDMLRPGGTRLLHLLLGAPGGARADHGAAALRRAR